MSDRIVKGYQSAEYGKFLELSNNSNFPPVSVVRWSYPDTTSAFPGNSAAQPLSSVDIYPKYSVLTTLTNPEDISISLSAGNINVNLSDVENLVNKSNTLLDNLTGNVLDIEALVSTNNTYTNEIRVYSNNIPTIASDTSYLDDIYNYATFTYGQVAIINNTTNEVRNSLFNGIGGYSLGGYFNSYNIFLSSIDATLKNGLNVEGGGGTFTEAPVKKIASDTLVSSFITPSANRIYNIFGVSTASVGQYLQIYDVAGTTPTGTPAGIFFVPANSNFNFEFVKGMPFTNTNALIVNSITPIDYNAGNSDLFITVIYN